MRSTKLRLRLAHDHEDLPGVDGDLAGPAGAGQAGRRMVVRADDRRVDVAEPVDLRRAEEPDVDEPALEVVAEQLEHAHDRRRAGHDRRVADGQRQPGRPGAEDARLVDELEVGRHGPLGEVDRDVRQADADEADVLLGELAGGGHDHHLGLAEGGLGHGTSSMSGEDRLAESPGDLDHPVRAVRGSADPQAGIAAGQDPFGDRMEDLRRTGRRRHRRAAPAR